MKALLRTIKKHGWLIMYGRCGEHSHSCMHLSMCSFLYSSYESAASVQTDFWGKSQGYRTPIHIHNILPCAHSCTVCHLIFFLMCSRHACIIVRLHMLHATYIDISKSIQSLQTEWNSGQNGWQPLFYSRVCLFFKIYNINKPHCTKLYGNTCSI